MTNAEILNQLRDIHYPESISWWPPAWGWYLLFLLSMVMVIALIYLYKLYKQKKPKRFALSYLQNLYKTYQHTNNSVEIASEISLVLKQVALHYYPREQVGKLQGEDWLAFLE